MSDSLSKYLYVEEINNSGTAEYDQIVTNASANDWSITNTSTGNLTFTGVDDSPIPNFGVFRVAIRNSNIGNLQVNNDGLLNIAGAIHNCGSADVTVENSGTIVWSGFDSTGVTGSGPAIVNCGINSSIILNNQTTGSYQINGYAVNRNGGDIIVNNAGSFTMVGTKVTSPLLASYNYVVSFAAEASTDWDPSVPTDIAITNTGTMALTGALFNDTTGTITVDNSGSFTLTAGVDSYAMINRDSGNIVLINNIGAFPAATLNIIGNIVNLGHGSINLTDFTQITGHIYGENITLAGSGQVTGAVVGNIVSTDTADTINKISVSGGIVIDGASITPGIVDEINSNRVGIIGASGAAGNFAGNVEITLGEAPPDESTIMLFAVPAYSTVNGNAVFGGVNTNVSGSVSGSIGTNVTITGNVFGGGYSTTSNANVGGFVTLNINGAVATTIIQGSVFGGGYAGSSSFTANVGTSGTPTGTNVTVKNATIGGSVYGSGWGSTSTVYGPTTITLSGSVNFSGANAVIAPTYSTATVTGYKLLNFTDYVGSVNASVSSAFNEIAFNKDTKNLSFTVSQDWSTVGKYSFDISSRDYEANHNIPIVNLSNVTLNYNAQLNITLKFAGQSTDYSYQLAQGTDLTGFNGKTITVYDKSNDSSVTLTVGGGPVQSSKNQNVFYEARIVDGNQLWLNAYNSNSQTILTWPKDYWDRYAPGTAQAVTVAAGATTYLGSSYTFTDMLGNTSSKGSVTLSSATSKLYGGKSSGGLTGNTWINIKAATGGIVFGGGDSGSGTIAGSSNIYIYKDGSSAAPTLTTLYGGGAGGTINGGSYIDIAGATISGNIYGGGTGGTVNGGSTITFAGAASNLSFTGTVYGNGNGGTVNGTKKLVFGDYDSTNTLRPFTGTFNGNFNKFDQVWVNANSSVSLGSGTVFNADNFEISGTIATNGKTINSNGAAAVNLTTETTGSSTTQFIVGNANLAVTNKGSLSGAKANGHTLTLNNTGTVTGELYADSIAITNSATGFLNAATLATGAASANLSITNSSRNANLLTTTGTFNVPFTAATTWLTNTGVLTLGNSGTTTIGSSAYRGTISNTGADFTWNNSGNLTYYGNILGNVPSNTNQGHIALNNLSGTATFNGVYNSTYNRDIVVLGQNPNAGSSFAITNTSGAMTFNGAVNIINSVVMTIENYGTMGFNSYSNGIADANIRATVSSFGPGGFLVENHGNMTVDAFRNESLTAGANSGTSRINNYSGTTAAHNVMTVNGRLFDGTEILPLVDPAADDVLLGQRVAITNIGADGILYLNNQSNADFNVLGVLFNADGSSTQIVNSGTMNIGYTYTGATKYMDSLINNNTANGINVTNTGALNFYGGVHNIGGGDLQLVNNNATAVLNLYGTQTSGVYGDAVTNDGTGNIFIDNVNTASTALLNIYGNIVNYNAGSVAISNYTLIQGDAIGKNISLLAGYDSTFTGNIQGGQINTGDNTDIEVQGGKVTNASAHIAGSTGSVIAGNTTVHIYANAQVAALVVGAGYNVSISGNSAITLENSTFTNSVYAGGYGTGSHVAGTVAFTLNNVTQSTGSVFGGGYNADIAQSGHTGNAVVMSVTQGSFGYLYGGGQNTGATAAATVYGNVVLTVANATFSRLYGGGYHASIAGNTDITIGDGTTAYTLAGSVFGAGYGNANVTGTAKITLSTLVSATKNILGGGLADVGQTQTVAATNLVINGATLGGTVYAGGYSNGGTVSVITSTITANSGTFNGWVIGGGYATGATATSSVTTSNVLISGGTFNSRVVGGGYVNATGAANVTTANLTISGGTFQGFVIGGGYSAGGNAQIGSVNLTISGGSFYSDILGGGCANTTANSVNASVSGNVSITLDASTSALNFNNKKVYCGGNQQATVGGSTQLTLKGVGTNVQNLATISGDSASSGRVTGSKTLVFDDFQGALASSIVNFDSVTITGDSAVTLSGSQNLSAVKNWNIVADSTPDTAMLTWNSGCTNTFNQDQITLDISNVISEATGYTQTLMQGASAIFTAFNNADISIGWWNGSLWEEVTNWGVSIEPGTSSGSSIMQLAKIAAA